MQVPSNFSKGDAAVELQTSFWNRWNAENREHQVGAISARQAEVVLGWLKRLGRKDMDILEVGCGSGWFAAELSDFGRVTATDLSHEVLERSALRWPQVRFVAGDFTQLEFGDAAFDVIVTLEVLSHVFDQKAFMQKMARHLRPGGYLMMATQNRHVLEKYNAIPPPEPGQLRRWVYQHELLDLLEPEFKSLELFTVSPMARVGIMRYVNSWKLNAPVRLLFGNRVEHLKERMGFGWTLMSLSRKAAAN